MEYIVNPAWFYWMSVAATMKSIVIGVAIVVALVGAGIAIAGAAETCATVERDAWCKKNGWKLLLAGAFVLVIGAFIPSYDTMTKMMIAKYVTVETIDCGVDAVKSAVDYIFQKIAELK